MVAIPDPAHANRPLTLRRRFNRFLERHLPEGLYPRSLIIVITPMVLLQSIMAYTFMERHWDQVTKRLSRAVARDIALVVELYELQQFERAEEPAFVEMVSTKLDLGFSILHDAELPPPAPKPFFSLLDIKLSGQITKRVDKPFWIDTVGHSGWVDIRVKVNTDLIFRFVTEESRAYASNTHIFILWMVGSAVVLLWVAIIFLRNQITPIQQLAAAAHSFGMGRDVPDFRPRGASEVQSAARAVLHMKERIERHVEQRTSMLAGVSHDLRTILTRFKLQLAFLGEGEQARELQSDVDEMQHMLEDYLAFVRGDAGESSAEIDMRELLDRVKQDAGADGAKVSVVIRDDIQFQAKPNAFKRCIANLVSNACRFGNKVRVQGRMTKKGPTIIVEDDGPGIEPSLREDVFRPFFRIDGARNQDEVGTGLGLAIALDIARSHGGDIMLSDSELGGLRAKVQIPN